VPYIQASSAALIEIPAINARIDDATQEIVYHKYTDISVAVASPTGLVVPVLRNCEKMSFSVLSPFLSLVSCWLIISLGC
jgi:2-oxoglutarate dehydrogenase E2 component (dihydrolipoamide succinyltransferase)